MIYCDPDYSGCKNADADPLGGGERAPFTAYRVVSEEFQNKAVDRIDAHIEKKNDAPVFFFKPSVYQIQD